MTLIESLNRHATAASERMVWGKDDCCHWVRDIVFDCTGFDILAGVPVFKSERKAVSFSIKQGGVLKFAMTQAERLGLCETAIPSLDNGGVFVGVVGTLEGPAMAVYCMERWFRRGVRGAVQMPRESAVIAWEVPHG